MGLPRNKKYTERECVEDMIEYCENILDFTKGLDREDFLSDRWTYTSTQCMFLKMGWAIYNLPRDIFDLYPEIDRRRIVAVGYMMGKSRSRWSVDGNLLWLMVQETVPRLLAVLKTIQRSWQRLVEDIPEEYRMPEEDYLPIGA